MRRVTSAGAPGRGRAVEGTRGPCCCTSPCGASPQAALCAGSPAGSPGWRGPRRKNAGGPMHTREKGHQCSKVLFCSSGRLIHIFMQRSHGAAGLSCPLSLLPASENEPVWSVMDYAAGALSMPSREAQPFSSWGCQVIYRSGPKSQNGWLLLSACHSCIWGQGEPCRFTSGSVTAPSAQGGSPSLGGSKALLEAGLVMETVAQFELEEGS